MDRPLSAETSDPAQEEEDTGCWLYRLVQLPSTYDVVTEGILPCLIVEVAISWVEKLWRADHVDKLEIYQRVGVPEYLIVDLPGPLTNDCFVVTGYRLDSTGARYEPIEPDSQGRALCKAVDVLFGVASDGSHLKFFEGSTGEPLMADRRWRNLAHRPTKPGEDPPNLLEETTAADSQPQETLDEIQARAAREVEARKNAEARLAEEEAKIARLRREAAGLRLLYVLKMCLLTRLGEQVLTEEKVQEAAQAC